MAMVEEAIKDGGKTDGVHLDTRKLWHIYDPTGTEALQGVDLVSRVRSFQKPGGNIGDAVNSNVFGILVYKAAGLEIPPGALQWQRMVQNPDGG